MRLPRLWTALTLIGLLLASCSTTTLSGSWKNPAYTSQVKRVYIVGIAKQKTTRRMLEDGFNRKLLTYGVTGLSSYNDIPSSEKIDEAKIAANVKNNAADSVLMTLVTGKRTEEVFNPGRIITSGPSYSSSYYDRPYYRNYGSYYNQRRETIYEPATISQFKVLTVEATLYDTKTKQLIWSAQLETVIESDLQTLIDDFVKTVTDDMSRKGLI